MDKNEIQQGDDLIFGAVEAAKILPYKSSWIFQLVSLKKIPHHKLGHRLIFSKKELRAWMLKDRVRTVDELEAEAEQRLAR